jgi:predicted nucleic acid-binding protein
MKTKGKIVYRSRSATTFQALTDVDDLKYLQTAMNSPHKRIITGDSDLLTIIDDAQIQAEGIIIWTLDEALVNL